MNTEQDKVKILDGVELLLRNTGLTVVRVDSPVYRYNNQEKLMQSWKTNSGYYVEPLQDLQAIHGIEAESMLMSALVEGIATELINMYNTTNASIVFLYQIEHSMAFDPNTFQPRVSITFRGLLE